MTGMVQTDLGPPTAKYKEEPVDDVSLSISPSFNPSTHGYPQKSVDVYQSILILEHRTSISHFTSTPGFLSPARILRVDGKPCQLSRCSCLHVLCLVRPGESMVELVLSMEYPTYGVCFV